MAWLIDTNVLSELRRPSPEPKVVRFFEQHGLREMFLSEVTLAEIQFGIDLIPDKPRKMNFENWLAEFVRPAFKGRVLPITEAILVRWRQMLAEGRKSGYTFGQPDLFIAATADVHELTVVSRDTKIYERAGVRVLNPWVD